MLYLLWNNLSHATTLWKTMIFKSVMNRPTVVNKTVAGSHAAVVLQFAVIFMRRQCQSICQRETYVIGAGLLERAWQALQSKVKTLDNIPASCLKINNPDRGGERTRERPHTALSFSTSAAPHTPPSSLPPHYARNPKLSCVCPALGKTTAIYPSSSFSSHLPLSSARCRTPVEDIGK